MMNSEKRKGLDIYLADSTSGSKQAVLPRWGWYYDINLFNKNLKIDKSQYPLVTRAKRDVQQMAKDFLLGKPDYSVADVKANLVEHAPLEHFFNRNLAEHAVTSVALANVYLNKVRKEPGSDVSKVVDLLTGTRSLKFDKARGVKNAPRTQRAQIVFKKGE